MLKSEMFKLAQLAVLRDGRLSDASKLEIVRVLACEEDIQKLCEKQREKEESEVAPY